MARDLIPISDTRYSAAAFFLFQEASVLDRSDLQAWEAMLSEDIKYFMPVRQTRMNGEPDINRSMGYFDEDYDSLKARIRRLLLSTAWVENPRSRTRRFVSNILVMESDQDGELETKSYLLLTRNRHNETDFMQLSCERHDRLRATADGMKLCRREIVMDQVVLGLPNLAIFL
jgi:3-phenylpropionate/cinnamic acid dioxygenase small subunit